MTTSSPSTRVYLVPDISCEHCRTTIEDHVGPVEGVSAVDVDIEAKTVTVTGGDAAAITAAIDTAGYDIAG